MDDAVTAQFRVVAASLDKPHRYVVMHKSSRSSYYNYYPTKFSAYMEAINPRYWGHTTIVMLKLVEPKYSPSELDTSSIT